MKKKLYINKKRFGISGTRSKTDRLFVKRLLIDLLGGKCIDCGFNAHLAALDFDHVDPSEKSFAIGDKLLSADLDTLKREANKCVIRCANCHRIKTFPDAN